MKLTPVTMVSLAIIGVGGFVAGRISTPGGSDKADSGNVTADQAGRSSSRMSGGDGKAEANGRAGRKDRANSVGAAERMKRLENIVRGENALDRNRALLAFIDQLEPGQFEEAVENLRSFGLDNSRNSELALLLTAWAKVDPMAALTYATEKTEGRFASDTILTSWASVDPEAAVRWALANHQGDGANPYLAGIIRGIAESDPVRATQLLTGMPRSDQRGNALHAIIPHILKEGPESARNWVAGIDDAVLRNSLIDQMAEPMAERDPKGTVDWLLANPGEASTRRMDDVFQDFNEKDPQSALNALASLPPGDTRSSALQGMVDSMASENPQGALAMMNRYPDDVNDDVVEEFVQNTYRNDPKLAVDQIVRIEDQRERDQMYRRTLGQWMDRDPGGVQAWLQTNPVSENVQNHLARRQAERNQ